MTEQKEKMKKKPSCYNTDRKWLLFLDAVYKVIAMEAIITYKYKLYAARKIQYLDDCLLLNAEIWNHCIALHKRHYRYFGKHMARAGHSPLQEAA